MTNVADKLDIKELLYKYALMVDQGKWELQDSIFHQDATIDYSSVGKGGDLGPYKEMLIWLSSSLEHSPIRYHFISNEIIEIDGDHATSCCCFNSPMALPGENGEQKVMTNSGYYYDKLTRTEEGWRIVERICDMGLQIFHE